MAGIITPHIPTGHSHCNEAKDKVFCFSYIQAIKDKMTITNWNAAYFNQFSLKGGSAMSQVVAQD